MAGIRRTLYRLTHVATGLVHLHDLLASFISGNLDVLLSLPGFGHERKETIFDVNLQPSCGLAFMHATLAGSGLDSAYKLIFLSHDIRNLHVMSGGGKFLKFLAGEDIDRRQVDFGVAVLSRL